MPNYTQNDLQLAIQEVAEGTLIRKAANHHNIPYTTLYSRINGRETRHKAYQWQQRLSTYQETELCNWLILQDKLGMAMTHAQIRKLVISILGAAGDDRPLGKRWIAGFLSCNPRIKTLRAKGIDSKRINGANLYAISRY
ncbi:transposase-like protein [Ilyonectria robusta]